MLTDEAYRERRWGWLPTLRQALEDKPPLSDGRLTSIDDSASEHFARLLEVAALAKAYPGSVHEVAQEVGRRAMHEDIERLSNWLRGAGRQFAAAADEITQLHRVIEGERLGQELG